MSTALATARWEDWERIPKKYAFAEGKFWLGRALDEAGAPLGYIDDRHILLAAGTRSGKGAAVIINNLILWPGSLVCIDPKGENSSVTAARRGPGSDYAEGMGQKAVVLDPYGIAKVDDELRGQFNPLDALDPSDPRCVRKAGQIANGLIPVSHQKQGSSDSDYFKREARSFITALILHIITASEYEGRRNLVTVRQLVLRGDIETRQLLEEAGHEDIPSGYDLLWAGMEKNDHFPDDIAAIATLYREMSYQAPKQWMGIRGAAKEETEFINNDDIKHCLSSSSFSLSELKTDPKGVSLYLCIPERDMHLDFRWLRMMINLITEEVASVPGKPATGHDILMCLDEFASLGWMDTMKKAIAQMAGYGLKLFFVLQDLNQLKETYGEGWQTFWNNSGLKLIYGSEDNFTRKYVSEYVGDTEKVRETRSTGISYTESESHGIGTTESFSEGENVSYTDSQSSTESRGRSRNWSKGGGQSAGKNWQVAFGIFYAGGKTKNKGSNQSWQKSKGKSSGQSKTTGSSTSYGTSRQRSTGTSENRTTTRGRGTNEGLQETVHVRPLIAPHEVGRFGRIDDPSNPLYPGLALVLIDNQDPVPVRKSKYYEDTLFLSKYDPHPDHGLALKTLESVRGDVLDSGPPPLEPPEYLYYLYRPSPTIMQEYCNDTYDFTVAEEGDYIAVKTHPPTAIHRWNRGYARIVEGSNKANRIAIIESTIDISRDNYKIHSLFTFGIDQREDKNRPKLLRLSIKNPIIWLSYCLPMMIGFFTAFIWRVIINDEVIRNTFEFYSLGVISIIGCWYFLPDGYDIAKRNYKFIKRNLMNGNPIADHTFIIKQENTQNIPSTMDKPRDYIVYEDIISPSSGIFDMVNSVGDHVEKGDIIFEIYPGHRVLSSSRGSVFEYYVSDGDNIKPGDRIARLAQQVHYAPSS